MNRIQELLNKRGMTQKDLERLTGIQQSVISRIINERYKTSISLDTAKKIAKALRCSVDYLWPD